MGLRSFVKTEGAPIVVGQRQNLPTLVGKLARFPEMEVARMQDIGGTRAIIPSRSEIERVVRRIRKNSDVLRFDDYTEAPKATGYRAVHVVVKRRGLPIEIQLRTPLQQRWAAEVDRAAGHLGGGLKEGVGSEKIVQSFCDLADAIALLGDGPATQEVEDMFVTVRRTVRPDAPNRVK